MGLKFQPKPGMVLICDFRGFEEPEMVKRRPVVVLAANRDNARLVTVIPLSRTRPWRHRVWHYQLLQQLKPLDTERGIWAKCDLLYTVSTTRLDLVHIERGRYGPLRMKSTDFVAIHQAAITALGSPRRKMLA